MVSQQQWARLAVREPDEVRRAVRASRRSWLIFGSLATGLCGMVAATKLAVFDQPRGFNPDSDAQLMVVTLVVLLVGLFVGLSWYARWQRRLAARAMVEHHGFYTTMFMPADQGMSRYSTLVLAPDGVWLIPGRKLARHESITHIAVGQIVGIRAWSEGRGSRGLQLEILGATGVLVRGWVLTMGRGQLGIEKFLDKLGQPPSNFSTSNGTAQRGVANTPAVAAIAGKRASGLVYPAVDLAAPRNYQWIIWKVMVGGFLPLFAVIAGAAQTAQFESVHRDPNAITVTATVDRVKKSCDKGSCSWFSYGHYTVAGAVESDVIVVPSSSVPTYGQHALRVVPSRPRIVYPVDDNGRTYRVILIGGLLGTAVSVGLNLRAYLRRRSRRRHAAVAPS